MRNKITTIEKAKQEYKSTFNIKYRSNKVILKCFPEANPDVTQNLSRTELEQIRNKLKYETDTEFKKISSVQSTNISLKIEIHL